MQCSVSAKLKLHTSQQILNRLLHSHLSLLCAFCIQISSFHVPPWLQIWLSLLHTYQPLGWVLMRVLWHFSILPWETWDFSSLFLHPSWRAYWFLPLTPLSTFTILIDSQDFPLSDLLFHSFPGTGEYLLTFNFYTSASITFCITSQIMHSHAHNICPVVWFIFLKSLLPSFHICFFNF